MNEDMYFEINIEEVRNNYRMNNGSINHKSGNRFKLLPYITDESKQMTEFNGVIGAFSRIVCDKELKTEFNINEFIEVVAESIGEFEGGTSKEAFKNIVRTLFIDKEDKLVNFDLKTMNYIASSNEDIKFAKFLYSIFCNEELKVLVKEIYGRDTTNILNKLVLNALPNLKEKQYDSNEYKCYLPFISELFIKDFKFLIQNEDLYKNSLKRFLEYYYMFYVSQLAMKLSKFEKADLEKPDVLYYTLSWESTSKNRTSYKFGWDLLSNSVNKLFSHAITLDLLNHHNLEKQLTYNELYELLEKMNEEEVRKTQINELYSTYVEAINDVRWDEFNIPINESRNNAIDIVIKLFLAIDYQFNNSSRSGPYKKYRSKYINFVYKSFGKRRGSLGYSLNLNEEDIILLTKICINNNEKLKLSSLFNEFENRGISFDRDSKTKIIQLYEKLNLLEKKSDSGDAQYVRSVL